MYAGGAGGRSGYPGGRYYRHNRCNSSSSAQSEEENSTETSPGDPGPYKSRLCLRYDTPEGCRYGDKCRFAHGMGDLRSATGGGGGGGKNGRSAKKGDHRHPLRSLSMRSLGNSTIDGRSNGEFSRQSSTISLDALSAVQGNGTTAAYNNYPGDISSPTSSTGTPASSTRAGPGPGPEFGWSSSSSASKLTTSTSKRMSIGTAFAGAIIGKAGAHVKEVNRVTGAKVSIREHPTDPNLKNVEMEGSSEQIEQAVGMVTQYMEDKELLSSKTAALGSRTFKTKMCKNFLQGNCTFADRCHFAHGARELRSPDST